MGFIRGGLAIFLTFFLIISFFLGAVFLSLSWSLKYENVKTELVPVARDITENQLNLVEENFNLTVEMEKALESMKSYCENNSEYVSSSGGYTFVFPCEDLEEFNQTPDKIIDKGVETIIEQVYYEEYNCNFWNCFQLSGMPLFLVSEKAKDYWKEKFYYSIVISLILIASIFLVIEQKSNLPVILGSVLVLVSFPLIKLRDLIPYFFEKSYLSFISVFFSKTGSVFWLAFISGLVLLGVGISLKFLNMNFWKRKFSKKDSGEIVKKEVGKKK